MRALKRENIELENQLKEQYQALFWIPCSLFGPHMSTFSASYTSSEFRTAHNREEEDGEDSLLWEDGIEEGALDTRRRSDFDFSYSTTWPWKLACTSKTSWFVQLKTSFPIDISLINAFCCFLFLIIRFPYIMIV